jgi:hypothetical protein
MAIATSTQPLRAKHASSPTVVPVALGLICVGGGLILAASILQNILALGADAPYVTHLMALNTPVTSELGAVLGPAGSSVDNLLYVIALVGGAVAAILLIVGSGFWLSSARTRHPEATRRVSAVGLWMALILSIVAILPVEGTWKEVGLAGSGDTWTGSAVQLAVLSLLGLLLLQISAPQWRSSLREAFRD